MNVSILLAELVRIRPDFAMSWRDESLFLAANGSSTACGVFSHFTSFFREQHSTMTEAELKALAGLITRCEADASLANAAYTCFLENIAGDPPDTKLAPYLSAVAREFMSRWRPQA